MALISASLLPLGPVIALLTLVVLAMLMLAAALSDIRRRRIPNPLCFAVALLALPYWLSTDPTFPRLGVQILCGLLIGMLLMVPFGYRLLGGGDVKLMAALALWLPPESLYETILLIAIAGGVLALAVILLNRRTMSPTVPYGVAIAAAALLQVGTRINHLIR